MASNGRPHSARHLLLFLSLGRELRKINEEINALDDVEEENTINFVSLMSS